MSDFTYQPTGNKSFHLEFKCDSCNSDVTSEEIGIELPCYGGSDKAIDSQVDSTGYANCPKCDKEFVIDIYIDMYSGGGTFRDLSHENIVVIETPEEPDNYFEDLYWDIIFDDHYGIFLNHMKNSKEILLDKTNSNIQFSLYVMLYGHIVSAIEGYLASTFIHETTNSMKFIKKLLITNSEFAKTKFSINDIISEPSDSPQSTVKFLVAKYLKGMIYHKLEKVKPMYKSVLNIDFGDVSWLFVAVKKRHDCVHRAGFDIEGSIINISHQEIETLIDNCKDLARAINLTVDKLEHYVIKN